MPNEDRGKIKYPDRYKQLISYEGLERRRHITPTDFDGFIDYNGVAFIYIEGKLEEKKFDYGQRRALENVINSHILAKHEACAIIFRHNEPPDKIIIAKDKFVSEIYYNNKWTQLKNNVTLLECIEKFENLCELKGLNI